MSGIALLVHLKHRYEPYLISLPSDDLSMAQKLSGCAEANGTEYVEQAVFFNLSKERSRTWQDFLYPSKRRHLGLRTRLTVETH